MLAPASQDDQAHQRWRDLVVSMRHALGWADGDILVRRHASGTLLVMAAPADLLFTATEISEWAWEQASGIFAAGTPFSIEPPFDQIHLPGDDFAAMVEIFKGRAAAENNPALNTIRRAAHQHGLPVLIDDSDVSIGAGAGSETWPLTNLPADDDIPWRQLHDIPVALVTGSNGKTTTVRLLAALIEAGDEKYRGKVGYSSTEGIVIGSERGGEGDFSGPAGARTVLRDKRVEAAVLETARGGILRRGLAVDRADVAVVTNISADHFGEYGIDNLDDLAEVKLAVAHALATVGTLVLNADDPVLLAQAASRRCKVALFAADDTHAALISHREQGYSTCGAIGHELWLTHRGDRSPLGNIRDMPLTMNGAAVYNIANISAAALAAAALNVSPSHIANVLARFGRSHRDNPGRLNCWRLADITVIVDYAHNPDGLQLLMAASRSMRNAQSVSPGRIGLLLGQAGNREDDAIRELARTAADACPDFIVLKEIPAMLRGRALGEVPALLKSSLLAAGVSAEKIELEPDEVAAACRLLRWAKPGDVLVLPVHQSSARAMVTDLLDRLQQDGWRAGAAVPMPLGVDQAA